MRTINTTSFETLKTLNNTDYKNTTNKYAEAYKTKALEILNNPETTFKEFTQEQAIATDISRLGWLAPWAMLKEQLKYLWLDSFNQKPVNNTEQKEEQNSIFWAPNKTVVLWWLAA